MQNNANSHKLTRTGKQSETPGVRIPETIQFLMVGEPFYIETFDIDSLTDWYER